MIDVVGPGPEIKQTTELHVTMRKQRILLKCNNNIYQVQSHFKVMVVFGWSESNIVQTCIYIWPPPPESVGQLRPQPIIWPPLPTLGWQGSFGGLWPGLPIDTTWPNRPSSELLTIAVYGVYENLFINKHIHDVYWICLFDWFINSSADGSRIINKHIHDVYVIVYLILFINIHSYWLTFVNKHKQT